MSDKIENVCLVTTTQVAGYQLSEGPIDISFSICITTLKSKAAHRYVLFVTLR